MELIITTNNFGVELPLYCHWSGKNTPQPAYIELDLEKRMLSAECMTSGESIEPPVDSSVVRWLVSGLTIKHSLQELFDNEKFLQTCKQLLDKEDTDLINEGYSIISSILMLIQPATATDWLDMLLCSNNLADWWPENKSLAEAVENSISLMIPYGVSFNTGEIETALIKEVERLYYAEEDERYPDFARPHQVHELRKRGII